MSLYYIITQPSHTANSNHVQKPKVRGSFAARRKRIQMTENKLIEENRLCITNKN